MHTSFRALPLLLLLVGLALPRPATAEEGMWTLDNLPRAALAAHYPFTPDEAWVEEVRLSSVRLEGGCSGSLVSDHGLVMTNHHCIESCLVRLSTPEKDRMAEGFLAETLGEELICPGLEVNQLLSIEDVTARIHSATSGKTGADFSAAQRGEVGKIEQECSQGDRFTCDVVELYHGGLHHLYRYQSYREVRLVFAPEEEIAYFGGDPDNFNFPRYNLDMALLRLSSGGQAVRTPHYFPFSTGGAEEGELVFMAGHPGTTRRLLTLAELEFLRDSTLPLGLYGYSELLGELREFSRRGDEQARAARQDLLSVENTLKAWKGEFAALLSNELMSRKAVEEEAFYSRVGADPSLSSLLGTALPDIARAMNARRSHETAFRLMEGARGFMGNLFRFARILVRGAKERALPTEARLPEYAEQNLPGILHQLLAEVPVNRELEELKLRFSLVRMRELLGPDSPLVKKVLGSESPEALAHRVVYATTLERADTRKALWEEGPGAMVSTRDPMLRLASLVDDDSRALRTRYENEVAAVLDEATSRLARARFALLGTQVYPDATSTLRLTYGTVAGWKEGEVTVPPFTSFGGTWSRATGSPPFRLPPRWVAGQASLDPETPFNFSSTCDIVGGNSGSPVFNRDRRIVGLVFDGNIHSLGGSFGFDPQLNRAVSVDSRAMLEALAKVYRADRLVAELTAPVKAGKKAGKGRGEKKK